MPKDNLLDPKAMDGPVVKWTVADLFRSDKKRFMIYHVMAAGWDLLSPAGSLLGGALYGVGIRPYPTLLASMGTGGFVFGCGGLILGLAKLNNIASKGESASPPWTEEGIQQRVDGLSHNFKVRIFDLSAWSGIALATAALVASGGPATIGLSRGTMGVVQGLTLGSALGSIGAAGCIYSTMSKMNDKEDD